MGGEPIPVAVLGASGYTGAELVRLLARHPRLRLAALTAERHAGKPLGAVFPHLAPLPLPTLTRLEEFDPDAVEAVFCCLPHGMVQKVVASLPRRLVIVDLSADFRLRDPALYARVYGKAHEAPELQREAVYGLTEWFRDEIRRVRLIANPGCYPTAALLALAPLVKAGLVDADQLLIDAKSGVSGAGREPRLGTLFCEVQEGLHAYGVGRHRHAPEIDQLLGDLAGRPVTVVFTPHLVPMSRGILATLYLRTKDGVDAQDLHVELDRCYAEEPLVRVLPFGELPATRQVRGTALCLIGVERSQHPDWAVVVSVIDNLLKGASGQALQNMNLRFGLPETLGLDALALVP